MKKFLSFTLALLLAIAAFTNLAAASEGASYKDTVKKLAIAYLPGEQNPELAESRGLMQGALSEYLGIPVEEFNSVDYNATVEAMRTGHADMALFGPLTYVQATQRANAECLVVIADDGDLSNSGYYSFIVVKADSEYQTLDDLKGCTFGFVDPNSTSGNLVPTYEFIKYFGLTNDEIHTNGKLFESVIYTGNHPNSILAVLNEDVDAAAIAEGTLISGVDHIEEGDLRIIHTSEWIPSSPMAIRGDLPQDLKDAVLEFLLAYDNPEYFITIHGQKEGQNYRWAQIDDASYDYVRGLVETTSD